MGDNMQEWSNRWEEMVVGTLAVISIVLVIVLSAVTLTPGWLFTLYIADLVICIVFAWDFVHRLIDSPHKSLFLKYHGYEILAAIPAIAFYPISGFSGVSAFFRALRLVRVVFIIVRDWPLSLNRR